MVENFPGNFSFCSSSPSAKVQDEWFDLLLLGAESGNRLISTFILFLRSEDIVLYTGLFFIQGSPHLLVDFCLLSSLGGLEKKSKLKRPWIQQMPLSLNLFPFFSFFLKIGIQNTEHEMYPLKFLSLQYIIVGYKHSGAKQLSRTVHLA